MWYDNILLLFFNKYAITLLIKQRLLSYLRKVQWDHLKSCILYKNFIFCFKHVFKVMSPKGGGPWFIDSFAF